MAKKRTIPPIAHVYPPRFPHDSLEIIGNRLGLERVINALIDAVSIGKGCGEITTNDGFDADVRAICLRGPRRPEEWKRSGSPYWDVEDPMIARILELTEDNRRLRQVIALLRADRKSAVNVEYTPPPRVEDDPMPPPH